MVTSRLLVLVLAATGCSKQTAAPIESGVAEPNAPVVQFAPLPAASPMTVAFADPRMCAPGALVTWTTMMGERDAVSEATVDAAVEGSGASNCGVVLAPNLRDFVAVLPGGKLRPGADLGLPGYAAQASGDALLIGPAASVDALSSVASIVDWAGFEQVAERHPDGWGSGLGRFDIGDPIIGSKSPSKVGVVSFSISDHDVVLLLDGDPAAVEAWADACEAYVASLVRDPAPSASGPDSFSDSATRTLARLFGLGEAVAEGRLETERSGQRFRATLEFETTGEDKTAALTGLVSAIFAPTMRKFHLRRRTVEPRAELVRLYDAILATMYADPDKPETFRGCPGSVPQGEAGFTPPLAHGCVGPSETCTPATSGRGAYEPKQWEDNSTWQQLGFSQEQPHRFHYNVRWRYDERANGCQFTAQAFGDLDDDGVFSTFERAAAADELGVNSPGLYIDKEVE